MTDDDLDHRLAALDPAASDPPPAPRSDRYRQILERAMEPTSADHDRQPDDAPVPSGPTSTTPPSGPTVTTLDAPAPPRWSPGRRRLTVSLAAAAAVVLVLTAVLGWRSSRDGNVRSTGDTDTASSPAADRPRAQLADGQPADHWHMAYAVSVCGTELEPLVDAGPDVAGIHTHGDGLIHIHPFTEAVAGERATLDKFLAMVDLVVGDDDLSVAGRIVDASACAGEPTVEVAWWADAEAAARGDAPDRVLTGDEIGAARLVDGGALTIALVDDPDAAIPPPSTAAEIEALGAVDGAAPSGTTPPPTATTTPLAPADLLAATADAAAEVGTLRSEYRSPNEDGTSRVIRSEHDGTDEHRTYHQLTVDGQVVDPPDGDAAEVSIGERVWTTALDGTVAETTETLDERNAPYSVSAPAILAALGLDSDVEDLGFEPIRGVDARHLRMTLGPRSVDALEALPTNQRSGFELEYPGQDGLSIELWIANDQLVRVRTVTGNSIEAADGSQFPIEATVEFFDLGAPITIEAPA